MKALQVLGLVALAFGALACGEDAASEVSPSYVVAPANPADLADMRWLAASDTSFVVGVPAMEIADRWAADMSRPFAPQGTGPMPMAEAIARAVARSELAAHLDLTRPAALTMGPLSPSGEPAAVIIVPVVDQAAARLALEGLNVFARGRYLGFSTNPEYAPGAGDAALMEELPAGPMAARFAPQAWLGPMRPVVEGLLPLILANAPPPGPSGSDPARVVPLMAASLFDAIEDVEQVELAMTIAEGEARVDAEMRVRAGSGLAEFPTADRSELERVLNWVDGDAAFQAAAAVNSEALGLLMRDFMLGMAWSTSDPASEDDVLEFLAACQVAGARTGDSFGIEGSAGDEGMRVAYLLSAPDPAALLEAFPAAWRSSTRVFLGAEAEVIEGEFDGKRALEYRVDMNDRLDEQASVDPVTNEMMRSFYGPEGVLHYVAGQTDGGVLMTGSSQPSELSEIVEGRDVAAPMALRKLVERLSDASSLIVMRFDYAGFLRSLGDAMPEFPRIDDALRLPLGFYFGGGNQTWHYGLTLDLEAAGEVGQALSGPR